MNDHQHVLATIGLNTNDGGIIAPCQVPGCTVGLYQRWVPDLFPMRVGGIDLDIEDDPSGGVAKVVCMEAANDYQLPNIELAPGAVVLDIGAHVGVISCYLGKRFPDARIYALEPHPENYARLVRNLAANGVTNVRAIQMGMSGDGRPLTLVGNLQANSGGSSGFIAGDGVSVETVTMDWLFSWFNIDRIALLKIDCEGAEHEVLTDAVMDRVDNLVGEFHSIAGRPEWNGEALARWCAMKLGPERVRVSAISI